MEYTLTDWLIDLKDFGRCISCKERALERTEYDEVQCYSCGRWHSGYELGKSRCQLIHESTSYINKKRQRRRSNVQSYVDMQFEDSLTSPIDIE